MTNPPPDFRNCFLCRMMRGLALGGFGAALFGLPAQWLGAPAHQVPYYALFGALLITGWFTRKTPPRT
jgi:hypothetical protein